MPYLIGVDTGGTFTDFALFDLDSQTLAIYKYPSTPQDPSDGVISGLKELLADNGVGSADVSALTHGTTVATNAVVQDRLDDIGMITTLGFRDVLELGRQRRPHLYDLDVPKPRPLAPRRLRLEVAERINALGDLQTPIDTTELECAVRRLQESEVSAVAVCFLHAYRNSTHERQARAVLRRLFPTAMVSISSEVVREFREYERFATTALNAALLPVMRRYLDRLGRRTKRMGIRDRPRISNSFGSIVSLRAAKERPVDTLFSGPSAGVIGASAVASSIGIRDFITLDMGGTSTDVCLVSDGDPLISRERNIGGWPVVCPSLDVHSVGTGGGSVLWIDDGGFLQVGPDSAGAVPGPACYNLGGVAPTVTDANLAARRLSPTRPLGGRLEVFPVLAERAMRDSVAHPMGLSESRALDGTFMVLSSNLVRAVRTVSVERGYDPREFALVGFGGAGPMHVTRLARDMGVSTVVVPEAPGVLCGLGLLMADVRAEFSQSRLFTVADDDKRSSHSAIEGVFAGLERLASQWLRREGIDKTTVSTSRIVEARYLGQGHQIPISAGGVSSRDDVRRLVDDFHEAYSDRYGYDRAGSPVRFVHFRIQVSAPGGGPVFRASAPGDGDASRALIERREVYLEESSDFVPCPVYWRPRLEPDDRLEGPAIVEQMDATTVLLTGQEARVDEYRNLVIAA